MPDFFNSKRVVLVGNGPGVLRSGLGAAIDAFDTVVRFNNFVVEGFEADVGARTDVWASHFKGISEREGFPRRLCIHGNTTVPEGVEAEMIPPSVFLAARKEVQRRAAMANPFVDPSPLLPSSGLVAVLWICGAATKGPIALAGFDHFSKEKSRAHHYWIDKPFGKPKEHAPAIEAEMFAEFAGRGEVIYMEAR
jgi:hypothetical protein